MSRFLSFSLYYFFCSFFVLFFFFKHLIPRQERTTEHQSYDNVIHLWMQLNRPAKGAPVQKVKVLCTSDTTEAIYPFFTKLPLGCQYSPNTILLLNFS